ncbi:MAG: bifunctional enoyl-CoA hydratase/phosphate acetyltransferase [Defluviitaleaceae bacterium]|nr:bifunctional enoyl-CoA hydratase/phosphate acetyltransferase [Defluviitaleaceae bacterium]
MFENFNALKTGALKKSPKRIAVASAADIHSLEAIRDAKKELNIKYWLVGSYDKITEISEEIGFGVEKDAIINTNSEEEAAKKAVDLIRNGDAQVLMKGNLQTGTLLKAVLDKETGISAGGLLSHLAVLESPVYPRLMFITDGGMNIVPDLAQKKAIIENSIGFMRSLGYNNPNVAALAAVEAANDKMQETLDAKALAEMNKRGEITNCIIEGPLSFDLAVSPESAAIKGFDSKISGKVDLFLMPNISTGNITSKALIYLGGAKMAGCVLGASAPIILVSRGASAEEKLLSILLTL